ncbi:MAG: hypothetical protein IPJ01_07665 [Micavibrio sp.]|nr:hypothetical protein [Micavibrio sp.]
MLCLENHVDPVQEYLDALVWDGVPRLSRLLPEYFGAADTNLNQAIGRLMMVAAVRRVREPGCKFDTIVVLEGQQGTGKSTALTILAGGENFPIRTFSPSKQRPKWKPSKASGFMKFRNSKA